MERSRPKPLFPIDAGWLLLIPGLALLAFTTLAPAWADLDDARHARDTMLSQERWLEERNERARLLLAQIDAEDPLLIRRLTSVQHNTLPDGRAILPGLEPQRLPDADVSAWIVPPPAEPVARAEPHPVVEALDGFHARLWLIGLGGALVTAALIGWLRPTPSVSA